MEEIGEIRRARRWSFRELAAAAGTSAATLNAYERGRVSPTWATFERIARCTGLEPVIDLIPALPGWAYPAVSLRPRCRLVQAWGITLHRLLELRI